MSISDPTDEQLRPSKLGTKEYWDTAYTNELHSFTTLVSSCDASEEDKQEVLQIWFDEYNAEEKILHYLQEELRDHVDISRASFLDVGTGNGHLLFYLREEGGYGGRMVGVDYSLPSIELAKRIALEKGEENRVEFRVGDVIRDEVSVWAGDEGGGFDVVLDKGTFDAISLSGDHLDDGRRIGDWYAEKVARAVKMGGYFIVTSCNWTEDELRKRLEGVEGLEVFGRIKYPSFEFGGKIGQTLSSLCFRRREE